MPGGDATAVAGLTRAQRERGTEIEVLAYRAAGIVEDARTHVAGPLQTPDGLDGINLRRWWATRALGRWARENLPRIRPDLVHAHAVDVGFPVARAAETLGIPAVLTCHGVWFPTKGRLSPSGWLERSLIRRGGYRAITAVDAGSVRDLRAAGFSATLVPNGIDLAEFSSPSSREGPFRFLFVGRLVRQKGVDVLLDAILQARRRTDRPFTLDIVGDGPLRAALERHARDLDLGGTVRFQGSLPRAALVATLRASNGFVLPSRFEGFPIAIMEAWASGVPVISTAVGGIPDVCAEATAILVPPERPDALAQAMTSLMDDPAKQQAMAREGRALVEHRFTWDAIAAEYDQVYERVLHPRGDGA